MYWIDDADSYKCSVCGKHVDNPNKYDGVCPHCGNTEEKENMSKKYKITLTEEQMRVTQNALEEWFRLRLGQDMDFSNELAFLNYEQPEDEVERDKVFRERICRRDAIREIMRAVFHIAFSNPYGVPVEKTPGMQISECLWDAIRFARGLSRWNKPFQIGSEPVPKIEVIDDGKDAEH